MLAKVKSIHRPNWIQGAGLLLFLALLLPALLIVRAANSASTAVVVQPALLKLAAQQPDTPVRVIVQKSAQDDTIEQTVARPGGQVIKNLPIINAFAAHIPAGAVPELAGRPAYAGYPWMHQ